MILLKNNKKLFIDAQVILGLLSFRQITKSADESGGILVGSIRQRVRPIKKTNSSINKY
ncbi:hypothetical protein SIN01_24090 [Sporolactobacillus inulinus]|nr:hypothetical protein SIN01_24090 [Sporolactobacillus inulinus]